MSTAIQQSQVTERRRIYRIITMCIVALIIGLNLRTLMMYMDAEDRWVCIVHEMWYPAERLLTAWYTVWMGSVSQRDSPNIIQFIHVPNAKSSGDATDHAASKQVPPSQRVSKLRSRRGSVLQNVAEFIDHTVFRVPSYSKRFQIRTEISSELQSEFESTFTRYLRSLCKTPDDELPADCLDLFKNMMNISIRHSFTSSEVDALAQRVEYLSSVIPQTLPYLFIQLKSLST